MRKFVKKVLAFSLAATMVVQPLPSSALTKTAVQAAEDVEHNYSFAPTTKGSEGYRAGAKVPYYRYDTSPANNPRTNCNTLAQVQEMDKGSVSYQDNLAGGATKAESLDWARENIASEASNQSYIRLPKAGSSVTWTIEENHGGDGVTMRFTMPDKGSTGLKGSVGVYVCKKGSTSFEKASITTYGEHSVGKVDLTSYYMWQYGDHQDTGSSDQQFAFDEVHFKLDTPLTAGDQIRIQNDGDGGYEYGIDFVEIEKVPSAIQAPAGAVVVKAGSSYSQIKSAMQSANAQKKTLYLEPGTYKIGEMWCVYGSNYAITGAGMWYTKIQFTSSAQGGGGISGGNTPGHDGDCKNIDFSNMYINSNLCSRYGENAVYKCFMDVWDSCTIHDIWEDHFECGVWAGDYNGKADYCDNMKIINCRLRNNLADGVNFCMGTSNAIVYNCNVRNNGDDGLACWNNDHGKDVNAKDEVGNKFAYNTIEFNWRAGGIAFYGGDDFHAYNNYIRDMYLSAGIHFTSNEFSGYKFTNSKNVLFSNNVMVRCGTDADIKDRRDFGSVDFQGGEIKGVTFVNTDMYDSQNGGIRAAIGAGNGITFKNTNIYGVGATGNNTGWSSVTHSSHAVRQQNTGMKFDGISVKNIPTPFAQDGGKNNRTNYPWYNPDNSERGGVSNLPVIPDALNTLPKDRSYKVQGYPSVDGVSDVGGEVETTPKNTDESQESTKEEHEIQKVNISSLVGHYEYKSPYTYQKYATYDEIPDETYKYLVLTYTGDITYLRLEPADADVSGTGVVTNNYIGLPTWFNAEGHANECFVTADGSDIPLVGADTTIKIDLEASGIDVGEFVKDGKTYKYNGFHVHTADSKSGTGEFDITEAYLTNDEVNPNPNPNPESTSPIETTSVFGPGSNDVDLDVSNNEAQWDTCGLADTYSWTKEGMDGSGYQYQGEAAFSGITSSHKYLVMTYTGDISSLRLGQDGGTNIKWFIENKEGNFVTVEGTTLPTVGDDTTVVIDLTASGVTPSYFSHFYIHSGDGTDGTVTISKAWLTTKIPTLPSDETTKNDGPTTKPQPTIKPVEPITEPGPKAGDVDLSLYNNTSQWDRKGLADETYTWPTNYLYQGQATFNGITNNHKYLVMTYTGDIRGFRLGHDNGTEIMWFVKHDTEGYFVTTDGTTVPETGNNTTVVIDLAASGVSPTYFSYFHMHGGATDSGAGTLTISKAWLTSEVPDFSTPVPPEAPKGLTVINNVATWQTVSNAALYYVYLDDKLVGTPITSSFDLTESITVEGTHTVTVNAVNEKGYISEPTSTTFEVKEVITTPEVTTPEVTTPEVTTPEVTTPEVTTPEVTTPEVTTPDSGAQQGGETTTAAPVTTTKSPADQAEQVILSAKNDKDPAGSTFGKLRAQVKKSAKRSNKVTWKKVAGATKYVIYGAKCGTKYAKLAQVTKTSFNQKKLKKGTYYKYYVVAIDNKGNVLASSKIVHSATKGGKVGNCKKIKVNKSKVTLKKGKKFKIKAKQIVAVKKTKIKNHRKISFESSNTKVATVTKKGVIKAKGKGSCTIYVYAQNGIYKAVKVKVK